MIYNIKIWLWHFKQLSRKSWRQRLRIDMPLFIGLIALSAYGLIILYSAAGELGAIFLKKQMINLCLAFSCMLFLAQVPPRFYRILTPWLFFLGVGLLIAVLMFGVIINGSRRWLDIYIMKFQPSELMKLAVPMMVAWFLANKPLPPKPLHLIIALLLVMGPFLLIAKQPDLGTSLLVGGAGGAVLFMSGIRWAYLFSAAGLAAISGPILWTFLHKYQQTRILTLFNPESDPLKAGYHIIQSKIAIGSGGIYGKGWLNGSQTHLDFLPEQTTDFIFAVLAEEFGLIGIILLLSLYLFVIARGIYIATWAQETYTRLLAGAIIMTFFVYIFVNIGMVSGLLPVVGVPLPLISYGGTSLVTLLASFGILMSIHKHRKLLPT